MLENFVGITHAAQSKEASRNGWKHDDALGNFTFEFNFHFIHQDFIAQFQRIHLPLYYLQFLALYSIMLCGVCLTGDRQL